MWNSWSFFSTFYCKKKLSKWNLWFFCCGWGLHQCCQPWGFTTNLGLFFPDLGFVLESLHVVCLWACFLRGFVRQVSSFQNLMEILLFQTAVTRNSDVFCCTIYYFGIFFRIYLLVFIINLLACSFFRSFFVQISHKTHFGLDFLFNWSFWLFEIYLLACKMTSHHYIAQVTVCLVSSSDRTHQRNLLKQVLAFWYLMQRMLFCVASSLIPRCFSSTGNA